MTNERMRAVVIAAHGGVEALEVREVERPRAVAARVRVRVHDARFTQAHLKTGESVLVHAAGSGVGTAAVQLARAAGVGAVYGTARTAAKLERARSFGLDEGVAVGDDPRAFAEAVR